MRELPQDIGLLLDLGHLQISCNFNIDKNKELDKILNMLSDRIYEIHISENDGIKDSHKVLKIVGTNALKKLKKLKPKIVLSARFVLR